MLKVILKASECLSALVLIPGRLFLSYVRWYNGIPHHWTIMTTKPLGNNAGCVCVCVCVCELCMHVLASAFLT